MNQQKEKVWLRYEFRSSFNPGYNKNDAQTLNPVSRRPGSSKFKEKLMGHFRDNKIKSTKY